MCIRDSPEAEEHHPAQKDCTCEKAHHHDHADCACAHTDGHDHHEACNGSHAHENDGHHHHEGCGCGHDHAHEAHEDREIQGALKLYVKNLDCANCANKIEAYVRKMDNIRDASMNFSQGVLFVEPVSYTHLDVYKRQELHKGSVFFNRL